MSEPFRYFSSAVTEIVRRPPRLLEAAFHDTDILARILARMSVSVSMSVSWNAALTLAVDSVEYNYFEANFNRNR